MKNTKNIYIIPSFLAIVLAGISPSLASASLLDADITVRQDQKFQVINDSNTVKVNANANVNARVNASNTREYTNNGRGTERGNTVSSTSSSTARDSERDHKVLPPGIAKKVDVQYEKPRGFFKWFFGFFNRNSNVGTTTASTTLPVIFNLQTVSGTSSAHLSWKTNEPTVDEIRYSASKQVGASSTLVVSNAVASTSHSVAITGLSIDTKYYFTLTSKDVDGNIRTTSLMKFSTLDK